MKNKEFKLKFEQLKALDKGFRQMNNLRRWTEHIKNEQFNELNKQALNCLVTFVVAAYMEAKYNYKIRWERFPKLAIMRMLQKMGLADVTHSTYYNIVVHNQNKELDAFYQAVGESICMELMKADANEFFDFISEASDSLEEKIFKAASRIASLIEISQIKFVFDSEHYAEKYNEIRSSIKEMAKEVPAVNDVIKSPVFEILQKISKLRNQNRWAVRSYQVDCSVLGHLFDTAIFAYFMSINQGDSEKQATQMFFFGIWHDVPEAWTKDIPSPTKDAFEGFREASEEYELKCITENIYDIVPEFISRKIKSVMMEEKDAEKYKPLLKGADYVSADSECYRQIVAGSRDKYFRDHVITGDLAKFEAAEGKAKVEGIFLELVKYYFDQTKDLHLLE